jgi:hypothetical protein
MLGLPRLNRPKLLQTPHEIPQLFPFNRTSVYLLMAPESSHLKPKSVVLKGTSPQGPLELEIPVSVRSKADEMIHQLAARKATQELEEGHGWLSSTTVKGTDKLVKDKFTHQFPLLQRREAVRLGVEFQVGGKYCSFVAVEANETEIAAKRKLALRTMVNREVEEEKDEDWDMVPEMEYAPWGQFGGKVQSAPRRHLASKAARKAPAYDSGSESDQPPSRGRGGYAPATRGGGRGGGCGGRGSASASFSGGRTGFASFSGGQGSSSRPWNDAPAASARMGQAGTGPHTTFDDDMGFGDFSDSKGVTAIPAPRQKHMFVDVEAEVDEDEEEDEDMGFGLFDGPDDVAAATPPQMQRESKRQKVEESGTYLHRLLCPKKEDMSHAARQYWSKPSNFVARVLTTFRQFCRAKLSTISYPAFPSTQ